jgi:hypothetical protein
MLSLFRPVYSIERQPGEIIYKLHPTEKRAVLWKESFWVVIIDTSSLCL